MEDDLTKIVSIGHVELETNGKKSDPTLEDLPVIATRDLVLFPGVTFPVTLGRRQSIIAANTASEKNIPVGVFCQRDSRTDEPSINDLFEYGVVADVLKVFDLPDGTHTAILNARGKIKITGEGAGETIHGALSARVKTVRETNPRLTDKEFGVLAGEIRDTTLNILKKGGEGVSDLSINIESIPDPVLLVNIIATHSPFPTAFKQELLSKSRVKDRAFMLLSELSRNEQLAEIKMEIRRKAKSRLDEQQRNMFLQNQFEALREELYGDDDDSRDLRERIAGIDFPKEVIKTIEKELDKLGRLNPQSPDYSVQYSYLDLLTSLPWNKLDPLTTDFASAEQILDSDHYGLEKVKERILEQLAVMMNTPEGHSPIICLVGAPGVGRRTEQEAGRHGRHLRQRRVRHGAPRPFFHRRCGRLSARRLRLSDREGDRHHGQGPGRSRAPLRGHSRRRQGLRQAERDQQPAGKGGHAHHRRRYGLYLPGRQGLQRGQLPAGP